MIPVPPELLIEYFMEEDRALQLSESRRTRILLMLLHEYDLIARQTNITAIRVIHQRVKELFTEAQNTNDPEIKLNCLREAQKLQEELLTWGVITA